MNKQLSKCHSLEELASAFGDTNNNYTEDLLNQFLNETSELCRDLHNGQNSLNTLQKDSLQDLIQLRGAMENCMKDFNRGLSFSNEEFNQLITRFIAIVPKFRSMNVNN